MKILITGIGITGKSTLRRSLVKALRSCGISAEHYDADQFEELRHSADADCLDAQPENFSDDTVYVIEDVHGPMNSAALPLEDYDLVLYLEPDVVSHAKLWLPRVLAWFRKGGFAWEAGAGWQGTKKAYDPRNVVPILKEVARNFWNRKKWIRKDIETIRPFPHVVIRVACTKKGPRFGLDQ